MRRNFLEAEPLVTVTLTSHHKKGGFVIKRVDAQKPETILSRSRVYDI